MYIWVYVCVYIFRYTCLCNMSSSVTLHVCFFLIYFTLCTWHLFFKLLVISFVLICCDKVHPLLSAFSLFLLYTFYFLTSCAMFFKPLSPLSATCMCMYVYVIMRWSMVDLQGPYPCYRGRKWATIVTGLKDVSTDDATGQNCSSKQPFSAWIHFWDSISQNLEFTDATSFGDLPISVQHWVIDTHFIFMGAWDLNSVSHVYSASTLPTKLFPKFRCLVSVFVFFVLVILKVNCWHSALQHTYSWTDLKILFNSTKSSILSELL